MNIHPVKENKISRAKVLNVYLNFYVKDIKIFKRYKSEEKSEEQAEYIVDDPILPTTSLHPWEFEDKKLPTDYSKPHKIYDIFGTELRFFSPGKRRPDKDGPADAPDIYSCGLNKKCESDNGKCAGDDICSWNLKILKKYRRTNKKYPYPNY